MSTSFSSPSTVKNKPEAPTGKGRDTANGDAPLRLKATCKESLQMVSALLQDALVPYISLVYNPEEQRFLFHAIRFKWETFHAEHHPSPKDQPNGAGQGDKAPLPGRGERVFSTVVIESVTNVHKHNFEKEGDRHLELNLLALELVDDHTLTLTFSEGKRVRLTIQDLVVYLGDHHHTWPTSFVPQHPETA